MKNKYLGIICFISYISVIVLANIALYIFGIISVGFGFMAPAGSIFAGISFILRDYVQETSGKKFSVVGIVIGAVLSAFTSSIDLAIASGVTFLISEGFDFIVYTRLRQTSFIMASIISNIVGLLLDTFIFLTLAHIPIQYASGQIYAKTLSTVVFIIIYVIVTQYKKENNA